MEKGGTLVREADKEIQTGKFEDVWGDRGGGGGKIDKQGQLRQGLS